MLQGVGNLGNGRQEWTGLGAAYAQCDTINGGDTPTDAQKILDVSGFDKVCLLADIDPAVASTAVDFQMSGTNSETETDTDNMEINTTPTNSAGTVTWNDEVHRIPVSGGTAKRRNILVSCEGIRRLAIQAKEVGGTGGTVDLTITGVKVAGVHS